MEITWYGHSCIRLMERGIASLVADPFDDSLGYEVPKLKADIVTVSHDAPGHSAIENVKYEFLLDSPGEYEIGGVFITAITTYDPDTDVDNIRRNLVFIYDFDDVIVGHLGDLSYVPTQKQIEAFGNIDVLFVPIGGGGALTSGQAAEVISLIEPAIVVPMHYQTGAVNLDLDPLDKFLKEMGANIEAPEDSLKIKKSDLAAENTQVVVLNWQS